MNLPLPMVEPEKLSLDQLKQLVRELNQHEREVDNILIQVRIEIRRRQQDHTWRTTLYGLSD